MNKFDEFLLKRFKVIIVILSIIFLVALASFVYTLTNLSKKSNGFKTDNNQTISLTPSFNDEVIITEESKAEKELITGEKKPNTTEEIIIRAKKMTEEDLVAIIRLRVEGGEILNKKSPYIMIEGCNLSDTSRLTEVCVDIAKQVPFTDGEDLLTLTIKWNSSLIRRILVSSENGYYNGKDFNASK